MTKKEFTNLINKRLPKKATIIKITDRGGDPYPDFLSIVEYNRKKYRIIYYINNNKFVVVDVPDNWKNLEDILNTVSKEEAKEMSKNIRMTATKLPNKKMKLKEEWVDSFKPRYKNETYEIFVNPSRKEVNDFKDGTRWLADSKTKKFYIADNNVWHSQMLSQLNLANGKTSLPHFSSSRWLTGATYKGRFNSDALEEGGGAEKKYKQATLEKDWSWAYGYLPGLDTFVNELRKENKVNLKEDNIYKNLKDFLNEIKC